MMVLSMKGEERLWQFTAPPSAAAFPQKVQLLTSGEPPLQNIAPPRLLAEFPENVEPLTVKEP
jgi:hypothetical protein